MMYDRVLILFIRNPEKGMVKTRLADILGEEVTYHLYISFLYDLMKMANSVSSEKYIVFSAGDSAGMNGNGGYPYPAMPQRGGDLGTRMYHAFYDIFSLGFRNAVLIGSDCPGLPASTIEWAFNMLESHHLVLGPSTDGGYYLIGARHDTLKRDVFLDIRWSTPHVLDDTRVKAEKSGLSLFLLEQWEDIDELDDLIRFYRRMREKGNKLETIRFIESNKENFYGHL
jgi:rSAM/selenodomain-associated transferase 1